MGGPGSGWNRKTPAQHRTAGTFRPDRHGSPATALPAEFHADALVMVRRLRRLASRYLRQAEKGGKGAAKSIGPALKCLGAAVSIARFLGDGSARPAKTRLDEHLARRRPVGLLPPPPGRRERAITQGGDDEH